jgi:hypothetical protein
MLVLEFPVPYISDYHGISVVGSASLTGALLGEDLFHLGGFLVDLAVYVIVAALVATALRAARARSRRATPLTPRP